MPFTKLPRCARKIVLLLSALALSLLASQPWKAGDPERWTAQDVQRILTDSPWAQRAPASFGIAEEQEQTPPPGPSTDAPQAGMAGPHGATDGRWDGGVGRVQHTGPPILDVTVRWDSALPVRQAMERAHEVVGYEGNRIRKDYIITVIGLIPGGRHDRNEPSGSAQDSAAAVDQNELLAGLMRYSRLWPKGKSPLRPEDAKLDSATGVLHLFFPRTGDIAEDDKEVTFETRFGSLTVVKRFRLKDLLYKGQLEL